MQVKRSISFQPFWTKLETALNGLSCPLYDMAGEIIIPLRANDVTV